MFHFTLLLTFALAVQVDKIFPLGKPSEDLRIRFSGYILPKSQPPIADGAKLGFGSAASSLNPRPIQPRKKKPSNFRKGTSRRTAAYRRH
ncbi:hypothetical protein DSO57_1014265 [Entomophthora muscae]|uniref:Uncharacterized protein n=1 Tax=Entomophthora muscae TaxID=34485 RepID=A0ACC2RK48_9FUNG|nr:hypothetical protein DSO57_1014265 [Entomophthora muscae]